MGGEAAESGKVEVKFALFFDCSEAVMEARHGSRAPRLGGSDPGEGQDQRQGGRQCGGHPQAAGHLQGGSQALLG